MSQIKRIIFAFTAFNFFAINRTVKINFYSKYKEKLEMLILKSRFKEAQMSVDEKKEERYRTVVDEYYAYINDFPNSENRKEADNIFKIANKFLNRK